MKINLQNNLAIALIFLLAACAGGGGNSNSTSNSTQSTTGGTAVGTVTGFGSLIVNGVEYPETTSTTYHSEAIGAPSTIPSTGIQLGQNVNLSLDANGNVLKATVIPDVEGAVTSITSTVTVGSTQVPAVTLAGVLVVANTDSTSGPITTYGGGYSDISSVQVNDNAEVHGILLSSGGVDYVQASYIGKQTAFVGSRVTGTVSNYNSSANTFSLGSVTVNFASATRLPASSSLANGEVVSAFSNQNSSGGTLTANVINVRSNASVANTTLNVNGSITTYVSQSDFVVNGTTVDASGITLPSDVTALGNGMVVAVNGGVNSVGTLVAAQLKVFKSQVAPPPPVKVQGTISNFVSSANFTVRGVVVDASQNPAFTAGTVDNLQNGDYVNITGTLVNNVVVASSVNFVSLPVSPVVVDLTASVLAYDSGTGALSITANKPGTLTPETIALTIGSSVTFTGGSATSLTSGQTIEVHAIFDPASGAYTVSNIRIVNPPAQPVQPSPPASSVGASPAMAAVGQLLFNDTALSSSGKQSCATCHAPSNAFTQSDNLPVPLGGTSMTLQGLRNSPTVMYSSYIPGFVLHAPGAASSVLRPTGGIMWDGRQANLAAQAQQPFITSFEMGNASSTQVAALLAGRPYLPQFIAVFGQSVLSSPDATLAAMGSAIAAFEATDQFHPFSSKYDAYIQGNTTLTTQELAGMQAFNDIKRGNCAACHSSTGSSTSPALFTNYTYHNLGIPRNWQIAINVDSNPLPSYVTANGSGLGAPNHNYYDMGLCGPVRTDLAQDTTVCGSFKTPTLRNVGLKQAYDHNGVFTSLSDVVSFYATRNSNSSKWYKTADGSADILFNDIPVVYASNVEPLNNSGNPIAPHLTSTDVQNIVSFLCTLTDGFDPKNPSAYNASGQCMGL